jgi:hypothetical protein
MRVKTSERIFRGSSSLSVPQVAIKFFLPLILWVFATTPWTINAADPDIKPGDTIGPQNWQRVQGMVGENLLNRI